MKLTVKTVLTSILLATTLSSGSVMAHEGGKGGMKGLERMAAKLNLTASQKAQLDEIIAKKKADRDAVHANTTKEQREEIKKVAQPGMKKAFQGQIMGILTPEQRVRFEAMMEKKKSKKKSKKGRGEKAY